MWVQGTIVNVCGSVLVNLAANLLKLAHNVEETDKLAPDKQEITTGLTEALKYGALRRCCFSFYGSHIYASKLYWRLGAFLFALGSVINFLSLSMAAQSLLATLGGVQFVSNIFFARLILGEKVTKKGLLATVVIIVGLTIAVSFSDHASTRYTANGLIALYDRVYVTFIVCVAATLILAECTYIFYTAREKAGINLPYTSIIRPVTYSMVSATIGTQSVLQSKCLAELLRTDIVIDRSNGNDLFANGLFYIVLTAFLLGMAFWLYRLNNALKLFDGLVIIPIIQVFWVTSAVLQGGMFFKEFEEMSGKQSALFTTGVVIVFFGVYLIATSQNNNEIDDSHHLQSIDGDKDRLTDPEKPEYMETDLHRKRSETNVMIITCIGSPFKYEKARKLNSKSYSSNASSNSSNYDGCDRYYDEFAANEALQREELGDTVVIEMINSGRHLGEGHGRHLGEGRGEGKEEDEIERQKVGEGGATEVEDRTLSGSITPSEISSLLAPKSPPPTLFAGKHSPSHSTFTTNTTLNPLNSLNLLNLVTPATGPLGLLGPISPPGPLGPKSLGALVPMALGSIGPNNSNNSPTKLLGLTGITGIGLTGKQSPVKDNIKKDIRNITVISSRERSNSRMGLLEPSPEADDENEEI